MTDVLQAAVAAALAPLMSALALLLIALVFAGLVISMKMS